MTNQPTGLFPVSYEIGTEKPGAPRFTVHFLVYTPGKTMNGAGIITQAINPPLEVATQLHGDFSYMTVMPKNTHILVIATVTATWRMLSPNRQNFAPCQSCHARAARIHEARRS